ncbi:MAG: hypothetical protein M3Y76_11690 [Chloroflexota bacterium]|nr:hypothetical protein [Chloroflexota bacterium]
MHEPSTWRELLGQRIDDPQERQRIASVLGVSPITLIRWVKQESNPRQENLHRLLDALPRQRKLLLTLIMEEFRNFSIIEGDQSLTDLSSTIPVEFYVRVLHTLATLPKALRFWSLCDLIVQQALKQLDPHRLGMAIIVAQCMPPSQEGKVCSLREIMGRGTSPWESSLDQHLILLGAESLAGNAAISGHLLTNQKLQQDSTLAPGYRGQWEESSAAAPIMHESGIGGSLLVSSTQPDYFLPPRCMLIENYAELIALAFDHDDFYASRQIELGAVPLYEKQRPHFSRFRQRVMDTMLAASRNQLLITSVQAEQLVWQQLEEELLHGHTPLDREEGKNN